MRVLNVTVSKKEFDEIFSGKQDYHAGASFLDLNYKIVCFSEYNYFDRGRKFTMEIEEIIFLENRLPVIKLGSLLQTFNF